ncbi:hypothetical protein BKA69DRAFT_1075506 [Paraphysoderma sedebokerense]|nr:hypothetical protein BKA69DRAFT_1075506 [Paraphysoderma sedebokerense]
MGRMPMSCRDRFRDIEKAVNSGRWTPEEEALLLSTVKELQRGKSTDSDIKWSVVAQRVRTRNSHQCRIKWYDCLNVKEKVQDKRRKWNALDERYLLKRLYDSGVEEESAIHWNTLLDSDWNLWSADKLRRKWAKMKHRVPNVASKSFEGGCHSQ